MAAFASLAAVVLAAIAFAIHVHLDPHLVASWIAERRAFAGEHRLAAGALYFLAFVAFAAFSLPGAWIVSVAGGALFGPWLGLPLVLASSASGATAAMLAARYFLREAAVARFPELAAKVNAGVARDGALWVVAARLTPLIPFFVVNLAVGLTQMRAVVFAAATFIGSTPIALLYVLAGERLATLSSARDVASPQTIALLVALGLVTFAAKPIARWRDARRRSVAPKARCRADARSRGIVPCLRRPWA